MGASLGQQVAKMSVSPTKPAAQSSEIQIVLVEDDVHFQNALQAAIHAAPDMKVRNVAGTRAEGLQQLKQAPADVLVIDLGLPDGSGIDVVREAARVWPDCGIMVSTIFGDEAHVMQSIEAGAAGYLLKDSAPEAMVAEIRSLYNGGSPISPMIARQILMRFRQSQPPTAPPAAEHPGQTEATHLSAREKEVLTLVTKGYTANEIAGFMQISRHTVQTFVRRVYSKLKVTSKAEAIYEARHQGLLQD